MGTLGGQGMSAMRIHRWGGCPPHRSAQTEGKTKEPTASSSVAIDQPFEIVRCWECSDILFNTEIVVEEAHQPSNYIAVFHPSCRKKATMFDMLEGKEEKESEQSVDG